MQVVGKVIKADQRNIVIQIPKSPSCAGCRVCRETEEGFILEAENQIQAQVGDLVKVVLPEKAFLAASFLSYSLPLAFFFLGYLLGSILSPLLKVKGEGLSIFFSFLFLSLAFLGLRLYYPASSKRASYFLPQAQEIVSSDFSASSCDFQVEDGINPNRRN